VLKPVVLVHNAEQINMRREFGSKLSYGDASRTDLLEATGARTVGILVITVDDREKIAEIVATPMEHLPFLKVIDRSFDRVHAYELVGAGADKIFRGVFALKVDMCEHVLVSLGQHPFEGHCAAMTFKASNEKVLLEHARHAGNAKDMVDIVRTNRAELSPSWQVTGGSHPRTLTGPERMRRR
jgi:hypothetical protein